MEIVAMTQAMVNEAASVLEAKATRHWEAFPEVPVVAATEDRRIAHLSASLKKGPGVAVFEDGRLQAYLLGEEREDERGQHTWVSPHASAYRSDPELIRFLYARLAPDWVTAGRVHHYAQVPITERDEIDRWLHLAFALQQVHGARSTIVDNPSDPPFTVRRAGPGDEPHLTPLFRLIPDAHRAAPVFAFINEEFYEGLGPGHAEALADPTIGYFVADDGSKVLGYATFRPVPWEEANLLKPEGSVELIVAATSPQARGRGVMRALVEHGMGWARENDFRVCVTDWRAANLDSSTAWPRLGFKSVGLRLHRLVDPRVMPH